MCFMVKLNATMLGQCHSTQAFCSGLRYIVIKKVLEISKDPGKSLNFCMVSVLTLGMCMLILCYFSGQSVHFFFTQLKLHDIVY